MQVQSESRPVSIRRRIVVWGATGSGKTTVARRLGAALNLGVVDLDAIRHANGWNSTPFDEFRAILTERLDGFAQGWVVAGSYSNIMDVYLSRADTVIWLHLPWRVSFWRLLQRSISRAWTQEPVYEGSPARESFRLMFLDRESILLWSITHHRAGARSIRGRMAALPPSVVVRELRSARQVEGVSLARHSKRRAYPLVLRLSKDEIPATKSTTTATAETRQPLAGAECPARYRRDDGYLLAAL